MKTHINAKPVAKTASATRKAAPDSLNVARAKAKIKAAHQRYYSPATQKARKLAGLVK
jgi:hypothetical protein